MEMTVEPDEKGLAEVRRSGRGFMLVKRELLEMMKEDNGGPALRYHNHEKIEWDFFTSGPVTNVSNHPDYMAQWQTSKDPKFMYDLLIVNNSIITNNNIGVQSSLSVRLSNNDIAFNNTAVSGASGTFGNNRFSGNGSIGTAPTPLGGASSDIGQQ